MNFDASLYLSDNDDYLRGKVRQYDHLIETSSVTVLMVWFEIFVPSL